MRSVCRRFFCAALAGWLVAGAWPSDAQTPVRQVLLLQSFHHGVMVHDYLTGNLQVDLDQLTGRPVNVVQVIVSPAGNVGASDKAIVDYIHSLYADRPKPDLIVTIAGPASVFARKYRRQLFAETPLLLAAVDQRYLGDAPLGENETAVPVNGDFPRGIDQILAVAASDEARVHGDGIRIARQILACTAREGIQAISRSADVHLVRRFIPRGHLAPLCQASQQFGDLLSRLRQRRGWRDLRGRPSACGTSCHGKCAHVWRAERDARDRHCRREHDPR